MTNTTSSLIAVIDNLGDIEYDAGHALIRKADVINIIRQHEAQQPKDTNSEVSIHPGEECKQTETLIGCPHCDVSQVSVYENDYFRWQVGCGRCGSHSGTCKTREEAIALWNTRVPVSSEIIDTCPDCNEEIGQGAPQAGHVCQSEITDKTDEFCITRDFEEWANLAPFMPLSKDGDGEYEDVLTKRFFACFEAAYKKGMWGASRKINNNLTDEVERLQKREIRKVYVCTSDIGVDTYSPEIKAVYGSRKEAAKWLSQQDVSLGTEHEVHIHNINVIEGQ